LVAVDTVNHLIAAAKLGGRFGKQDFVYLADQDVYRCPAGQALAGQNG
jgi:hypothetical protein